MDSSLPLVKRLQFIFVSLRVVTMNLEELRHEAAGAPPFDVQQEVDRIGKVGLDGLIGQVDGRLECATHEARDGVVSGIGVDGAESSGMAGVQSLKKIEGFPSPDFTDDDAVRPVAEGGSQQVPNRHCWSIRLLSPGFKPNQVALANADLCRFFDEDDALLVWDKLRQDVEQRCLSGPRTPTDQDISPAFHFCLENLGQIPV